MTRKTADPEKVAPFLGRYHNDELGDVKLVLHEGRTLWIDFGEYESSIRPLITEENQYIFFESTFIGRPLKLMLAAGGKPMMKLAGNESTYDFISEQE